MSAPAGLGVEITPVGVRAVAVDADGQVLGTQHVAGVSRASDLATILARVVVGLGGPGVPVAIVWDGGRAPTPPGAGGPGDAPGPSGRTGDAVHRAARRAGLAVVAAEPAVTTRARGFGLDAAEAAASFAAGRRGPPIRRPPTASPGPRPPTGVGPWVVERVGEDTDPAVPPAPRPPRRRRRAVAARWRAVVARRCPD